MLDVGCWLVVSCGGVDGVMERSSIERSRKMGNHSTAFPTVRCGEKWDVSCA